MCGFFAPRKPKSREIALSQPFRAELADRAPGAVEQRRRQRGLDHANEILSRGAALWHMASMREPHDWSIDRALQLYNIANWGAVYFSINQKGHLTVHPCGQPGPFIYLMDVPDHTRELRRAFPSKARFEGVLRFLV